MVLNMNNWFGDGNGYVGNPNLKPEVAHTLSMAGTWHDAAKEVWETKISPYYTRVENYIDAVVCPTCAVRTDGFVNLSLANQTARLYGADISGRMLLATKSDYGSFSTSGVLNYVNGKNLTTGDNLYNIMPLNLKLAVEQRIGNWTNSIEAKLVAAKTKVQAVRKEIRTGGYGLLNFYSSYEWKQARLDIGLENLLNKFYTLTAGRCICRSGSHHEHGRALWHASAGNGALDQYELDGEVLAILRIAVFFVQQGECPIQIDSNLCLMTGRFPEYQRKLLM